MDLERIVQKQNETNREFLERVNKEINKTDKQYIIEFLNGIELRTENYDFSRDNVLDAIENDYQKSDDKIETASPNEGELNSKNEKRETMIEIKDCVDMLELAIVPQKQDKIDELSHNLEALKAKDKETRERIAIENKVSLQMLVEKKEKIEQELKSKTANIDEIINQENEKISRYKEDIELQTQKMHEEKKILNGLEIELNELKSQQNPNLKRLSEVALKVDYYNWSMEAYTEYIDYINQQVEESKLNIEDRNQEKETAEAEAKQEIRKLISEREEKFGPLVEKDGKIIQVFENIPEIKKLTEEIQQAKLNLKNAKENVNFQQLREMITNKVAPVEVVEQLNNLTRDFNDIELEDKLGLNNGKLETYESEIAKLKEQATEYRNKLQNEENYIDIDQQKTDEELREKLKQDVEKDRQEVEALKQQLEKSKNIKKISQWQKELKTAITNREYLERKINSDELIDQPEVLASYERRVENLKRKEEDLNSKIQTTKDSKQVIIPIRVKHKIAKLQDKIIEAETTIKELDNKTKDEYISFEKMDLDEIKLKDVESKIEKLEDKKNNLNKITIADIKQIIVEDYMNLLQKDNEIDEEEIKENYEVPNEENEEIQIEEEEIVQNYEEAPKSLIEKIKSKPFIKKAAKALAGIVAGVVIVAGMVGIVNNNKNNSSEQNSDVITEDDLTEEVNEEYKNGIEEVNIDLEEPTVTIEKVVKEAQEKALEKIREDGSEAIVYSNIVDAVNEENGLKVNDNSDSWENAEAGALYAVKDNEHIKISIADAEKYIEEGYEIGTAFNNDDMRIGFMGLELTEGLGSTGKSR